MKHTGSVPCLAVLMTAALLLSAPIASALTTITFTSTADFDAGTKSQPAPADGNYQVETNTDNLGIAAGAFELTSLKGDSFTLADTDADTFKWTPFGVDAETSFSVAGGVLNFDFGDTAGNADAWVSTGATVSGNVDIRASFTAVNDGSWVLLRALDTAGSNYNVAGQDGYLFLFDSGGDSHIVYRVVNGVLTQIGTTSIGLTAAPYWLRIQRTSSDYTFYRSTDGSAWTQDEQDLASPVGSPALSPGFEVEILTADTALAYDIDDFYLASGTVDSGGFRTSGSWTSATQTYVDEVVTQVVLTYSGVSATNYIDAVSIRDGLGNQLFLDDTDITSGTTATVIVTFDESLRSNWAVRVTLAGGGAGTPTIESVVVTTDVPATSGGGTTGVRSMRVRADCTYIAIVLSWTCADVTDYTGFQGVKEVRWVYDGEVVAVTEPQTTATFPARDTWLRAGGTHTLVVFVILANGGRPMSTFILQTDNRLAWALLAGIIGFAGAAALNVRRSGRDSGIVWEPWPSGPQYRGHPHEEFPKGWRSYTVRPKDRYGRTRSFKRGNVQVIYGIRSATATEQARTGRRTIAEVQTVREKA